MTPTARAAFVAEVRRRRAEFPGASGWTPLHFDALLHEIDALLDEIDRAHAVILSMVTMGREFIHVRDHGFEAGVEFAAQIAAARGDPRVAPYYASEIRKARP